MSRWRSIKFDQCSLGPILCVVCSKWERLKEEKSQRQRRTCMYSSVSGRYCVSSTCGSRNTPHNILYHFLSALLALCCQWAHINSLLLSRKDIFFSYRHWHHSYTICFLLGFCWNDETATGHLFLSPPPEGTQLWARDHGTMFPWQRDIIIECWC